MKADKRLTLIGHLEELRSRLLKSVAAIAIGTAVAFFFAKRIFDILTLKAQGININLIYVDMTEMLGTYMKVSLVCGVILAMPFLVYQLLMFVSPALSRREKRLAFLILPGIMIAFAAGVAFGYFMLIPPATRFLTTFGSDIATPQIRIGNYISLVTRLLFFLGLAFETPIIISFLTRIGVITPKWLSRKRKYAIVIAFILGAIITPTFDPVNQTLVALPIVGLYELSIWLGKLVQPKRARSLAVSPQAR